MGVPKKKNPLAGRLVRQEWVSDLTLDVVQIVMPRPNRPVARWNNSDNTWSHSASADSSGTRL